MIDRGIRNECADVTVVFTCNNAEKALFRFESVYVKSAKNTFLYDLQYWRLSNLDIPLLANTDTSLICTLL